MADELSFFLWHVPVNGYKCINAVTLDDSFDAESDEPGFRVISDVLRPVERAATNVMQFNPLVDHTGLFRMLALETEPNENGILRFANQYGLLGLPSMIVLPGPTGPKRLLGAGEKITEWQDAISELRRYVTLWDAVQEMDRSTLRKYIHWASNGRQVQYRGIENRQHISITIASDNLNRERFRRMKHDDLRTPALLLIQTAVNKKLYEHNVQARLLRDENSDQLGVHLVPHNLIGCVWLQFAKAIEGGKAYRRCRNGSCGKWFEVGGNQTARSDKQSCSPTCKAAAHRKKQERARELFEAGVSVRDIAAQLGAGAHAVRGWIRRIYSE